MPVIPAKAGIQIIQNSTQRVDKAKGMIDKQLDSGLRRNDGGVV
jgi:hypothetical protein